jgi:hypothetical protein
MQSWQPGKRAWSTLAVVLAGSWVGACDADDTGLFSDDAPLSPTGGSETSAGSGGGSMAAAAGAAGAGGARPPGVAGGSGGESNAAGDDGGSGGTAAPDGDDPIDSLPVDTPDVAFQDGSCPDFVPCGGALAGSWVYSDACIEDADLGLQLSANGCDDLAASIEATVSGGLRFSGNEVQRQGTGSGGGELRIPNLCTLAIASCPGLRALIDNDADACLQSGTDCLCDFATEELEWEDDTFQIAGSTFTLGDGRTFDYCVEGDTLTYRETSAGVSAQDAALHVLTRQ